MKSLAEAVAAETVKRILVRGEFQLLRLSIVPDSPGRSVALLACRHPPVKRRDRDAEVLGDVGWGCAAGEDFLR